VNRNSVRRLTTSCSAAPLQIAAPTGLSPLEANVMPGVASENQPEGLQSLYLPHPHAFRSFIFVPSTFWPLITKLWMTVSSVSPTLFSTKNVNELVS
jgi:hypothetical protein